MSTCPKCGANNKPSQEVCRLCATPLEKESEAIDPRMIDSLAATVMAQGQDSGGLGASGSGDIACPTCQTLNERSWAFCQHCGSKLQQSGTQPTSLPDESRLQRAPETVVVPSIQQGDFPAPPTPASAPKPPPEPQTVVVPRPSSERQAPPAYEPYEPQAPARQAPVAPQAPVAVPPAAPVPPPQPPPAQEQRVNPPANIAQPQSPPPIPKIPGGTPCPECGHQNAMGSAFCGGCGRPIPVARTIVMSSVQATPKGRLHLIMEGGQQGEVYDLKDDTVIGRTMGDISFPHDGFMSSRHARIVRRDDSFILVDEGSRNGTFIKIKNEVELKPGDMILIGKQLFRFEV